MIDKTPEQVIALAKQCGAEDHLLPMQIAAISFTVDALQAFAARLSAPDDRAKSEIERLKMRIEEIEARPAALPVPMHVFHRAWGIAKEQPSYDKAAFRYVMTMMHQALKTNAPTAALPVPAYDVKAAVNRIIAVNIKGDVINSLNALRAELLAAAGSKATITQPVPPASLPPLPSPTWMMPVGMAGKWDVPGAFTSEQMLEYAGTALAHLGNSVLAQTTAQPVPPATQGAQGAQEGTS